MGSGQLVGSHCVDFDGHGEDGDDRRKTTKRSITRKLKSWRRKQPDKGKASQDLTNS
jgi:hypothetical protein